MRHQKGVAKLGKTQSHRRAMLRNMVTSLLQHERIRTTEPKAKEARRYAERMITWGKRGDLAARRLAARFVNDETVLKRLFDEVAPKLADRKGGYTRITHTGPRKGDGADMVLLELVTHSQPRAKKGNRKNATRLVPFSTGEAKAKGRGKKAAAKAPAADAGEAVASA